MLTYSFAGPASVKCTGGSMPVLSFPAKPLDGAVNLFASPEEAPTRERISWPGEYDVSGITVRGIAQMEGQKVSYMVENDGVRTAFISAPLEDWEAIDIEHFGDIHVLVLPAEDAKKCQTLIDEIDPRVLILVPGLDGSIHPDVLKAAGAQGKEVTKDFKLKGIGAAEGREVVILG